MKKILTKLLWLALVLAGVWAYGVLALHRGEHLNSAYILIAALCSYAIGYRFYSKWIAARVLMLNDRRATPCEVHDDGKDFVKTNKWIVFGHHFAAISGPGPLVGPVLAAQFGYLPGTLWILIGVVLGGAVQDFVILFSSLRRDGKSLGQMVKEELSTTAGAIALIAILAIMIILLAVLALVVVKALADSPWGIFTVSATIPIAMMMGCYLRFGRVGKVMEASVLGVVCLLLAVWGGKLVHENSHWASLFGFRDINIAWGIIVYGFAASVLPVWLLLAPRDYLSTFMKLGTIFALALGIFLILPDLKMGPVTRFIDGSGPVVAGKVFPFCFITIACGAISGFHTLIASGTTPKLITRESYARPIGYGAMCLESLVAIMALIAACTLDPGVYLSMNIGRGDAGGSVSGAGRIGTYLQAAGPNQKSWCQWHRQPVDCLWLGLFSHSRRARSARRHQFIMAFVWHRQPNVGCNCFVPLIWLLAVTMTAGVQKIFHSDPRIGFLAQASSLAEKQPALDQALNAAKSAAAQAAIEAAQKAAHTNQVLRFNNILDAIVASAFLVLVAGVVLLSLREWILLLARRKLAILKETDPVWLPDFAVAESRPLQVTALLALAFALLKELSGEAHLQRAQDAQTACACKTGKTDSQIYKEATEHRFNGIRRCC